MAYLWLDRPVDALTCLSQGSPPTDPSPDEDEALSALRLVEKGVNVVLTPACVGTVLEPSLHQGWRAAVSSVQTLGATPGESIIIQTTTRRQSSRRSA
jgi:hypothetical protein